MSFQDQLRALLRKHCTTINELIGTMDRLFAQRSDPSADRAALVTELKELAHQIKGSSGSIGFSDISAAAAKLDGQLRSLKSAGNCLDPVDWQAALAQFHALQRIAQNTTPEKSTLYNVDLVRLSEQRAEADAPDRSSGGRR